MPSSYKFKRMETEASFIDKSKAILKKCSEIFRGNDSPIALNPDQQSAMEILKGQDNVFLTGAAGSGKSFLIRAYLKDRDIPILASTGAAAILVGGRTFHSFFGLGIMEGGINATIDRALKNKRVTKRLKKTDAIVIDEISMISGPTLHAAETIARRSRGNTTAWGGIRVIAVGDFAQLPPVNPFSRKKEWAFLDGVWAQSEFHPIVLNQIMRTADPKFLKILNHVRQGLVNEEVRDFLESRRTAAPAGELTRLFTHRIDVEEYNLERLERIKHPFHLFYTIYEGKPEDIEIFRKHAPIAEKICIKKEALVMLRQNDPNGQWVNGSLGRVQALSDSHISIKLLSGRDVEVEKADFTLLNADGQPVVKARNFPLSLAWAMTVHKAQGTSLDRMAVNLAKVWEPGQAYVALSRARDPAGLFIEDWDQSAIFSDPQVASFHDKLLKAHQLEENSANGI